MSNIVYRIHECHTTLFSGVPVGTNLALSHILWAMYTGNFLPARGSVASALYLFGCPDDAIDRAEQALNKGKWTLDSLVNSWREQVLQDPDWETRNFEGYRPVAADLTAFYRPKLKGLKTNHYKSEAGKALPAIVYAIIGDVGQIKNQRFCLPRELVSHSREGESEIAFQNRVTISVLSKLKPNEVLVVDRGFSLSELHNAKKGHYVIRLRQNITLRRNYLPEYKGHGCYPKYGAEVRPQSRKYKDNTIESTPPDKSDEVMKVDKKTGKPYTLRTDVWNDVVLSDSKPGERTFRCIACYDSRFKDPMIFATDLKEVSPDTVRHLYGDRWGVEQPPLAAKQMLGMERQFVHGRESRYRLPGIALLAGSILTFFAAKEVPIASGKWDRNPKATCGRMRRYLSKIHFSDLPLSWELRKKASDASKLPSGPEARRINLERQGKIIPEMQVQAALAA